MGMTGAQTGTDTQPSVWIVDDDANVRTLIQFVLERAGFRVENFSTGFAVFERMQQQHEEPSVLISDIQMPELDGLTLLRRLRAILPALPVLLISGGAESPPALAGTRFLRKPFNPHIFVAQVKELLRHQPTPHRHAA